MEGMDPNDARRTASRYVCSDCYEALQVWYDHKTRTSTVRCQTEGCPCNGFVRKSTVERKEQKSIGELMEARYLLTAAGAMPKPDISPSQALAELGF